MRQGQANHDAERKREAQGYSVIPDSAFAILSPVARRDKNVNVMLFESDTGSIPIRRSVQSHRSIRHKLNVYLQGWKEQRHVHPFATPALQIAFVTNSPIRVEHMVDEVLDLTEGKGSRIFVFTDRETLAAAPITIR